MNKGSHDIIYRLEISGKRQIISLNRQFTYHSEMVETDKYINNVEKEIKLTLLVI